MFLASDSNFVTVGARVMINLDDLSDENDGAAGFNPARMIYLWTEADGRTPLNNEINFIRASGGEVVRTITAAATEQSYVLKPADVDNINKGEGLRARVDYIDGLGFARDWTAQFDFVKLNVGLNGAVVTSAIEDPNTIIDNANAVSRQWQESGDGGVPFSNITNATAETYTVPPYEQSRLFVRLQLTYTRSAAAGGGQATAYSAPVQVAGLSDSSTIAITSTATDDARAGVVWRAVTENLRDVFGNQPDAASLTYQWQTGYQSGGGWTAAANGTVALYTLAAADFADERSDLRLLVSDASGVNTLISAPVNARRVYAAGLLGVVTLSGDDFSEGGTITANLSGFPTSSDNGALVTVVQWEAYSIASESWTGWTVVQESPAQFTLTRDWDGAQFPSLRVAVTVSDDFGTTVTYSEGINLNIPTEGEPLLTFVNDAEAVAGVTISVDISNLSDGNNGAADSATAQIVYAWLEANGAAKIDSGGTAFTGQTYILTAQDVQNIVNNAVLQISIVYTDGLGYQRFWRLPLVAFQADIGLDGATVTLEVQDPGGIAVVDTYLYQWQQSAAENGRVYRH